MERCVFLQRNDARKDTAVYWRLNNRRFERGQKAPLRSPVSEADIYAGPGIGNLSIRQGWRRALSGGGNEMPIIQTVETTAMTEDRQKPAGAIWRRVRDLSPELHRMEHEGNRAASTRLRDFCPTCVRNYSAGDA